MNRRNKEYEKQQQEARRHSQKEKIKIDKRRRDPLKEKLRFDGRVGYQIPEPPDGCTGVRR